MDTLWAPWRMPYVTTEDKEADGCFLCQAFSSDDDAAALIVHRAAGTMILLNRYPYNNGHLLVAPAAHKAQLAELTDDELLELMHEIRLAQALLTEALHPRGFNIGINLGAAGGAGVPGHLHVHVVPRWQGDTNYMTAIAETRVIPQSLEDLRDALITALPTSQGTDA